MHIVLAVSIVGIVAYVEGAGFARIGIVEVFARIVIAEGVAPVTVFFGYPHLAVGLTGISQGSAHAAGAV